MRRYCAQTGVAFEIGEAEIEFCRSEEIPLPLLCPEVRLRRLFCSRNRSFLYTSSCTLSKKQIFSCVPPDSRFKVYDIDAWNSDAWDWHTYARPYDFSRPFFEQFGALYAATPKQNLAVIRSTMENSDYTNGITGAKNCYLVFAASYNEDCLFCKCINHSRNLVDCIYLNKCELCYDCKDCHECYNLTCSESCHNCPDSAFLFNCQGCSNCYGCVNLSQKKYHFFNQKLTREEYERRLAEIDLGSHAVLQQERERFKRFATLFPRKYYSGRMNERCRGNFIDHSKDCQDCAFISNSEDLHHCVWVYGAKKSFFQCAYGNGTELIYNCGSVGEQAYNLKFCFGCWPGAHDCEYCIETCYGSHDCFGCSSVKKAEYCILNKQYTKTEYLDLLPRIKAHMLSTGEYGTFFPQTINPHPFNRSDAFDFFPLNRAQAEAQGYEWAEDEAPNETSPAAVLPDHIRDVTDQILNTTLICARSGKRYKIVRKELDFYRTANRPLPRIAPMERLRQLSSILEVKPLIESACAHCQSPFASAYAGQTQNLLCEACYQNEIVG